MFFINSQHYPSFKLQTCTKWDTRFKKLDKSSAVCSILPVVIDVAILG